MTQDGVELEELEDLVDVAHHAGRFQIAAVAANPFDLPDEDAPARGADVVDTAQVHDHAINAEETVQRRLQFAGGGGVEITADFQDRGARLVIPRSH